MNNTLQKQLSILWRYMPLIKQLVAKDVRLKYRRSFLGYIWSILNPLMIMLIMVIVFRHMFRFDIDNYAAYLIIGHAIFSFTSESTSKAMFSITGNAALLKKIYVPKYIFTISTVTSSLVNMMFAMGAILIVFIVCHVHFTRHLLLIPLILLQLYIFCTGLGMFLAQANVFFRDIQHIYGAVLTAWMYLTPIFYPMNLLPEYLQWSIKYFNPLYSYIYQFRTIALDGSWPAISMVFYGFFIALIMLAFGTTIFRKTQDSFILYI